MSEQDKAVRLRGVSKRFGDFTALENIDLDVPEGSFVTFLGPSGCGKTTTLRMIAGLISPSDGDIFIRDRKVNGVPIHKRNLGLVFQNYALFPHKTVFDNVAFGLRYRKVDKATIAQRVNDALKLVQLPDVGDRRPSQLSGGQQQRIALARAIVIRPDVLLLDEPLSALDANLREGMRVELKHIQRELGVSTVFVTHDQSEALALSDQVVVMNHGHIEQVGTPAEVYNAPATEFVADFLGHSNIFSGRIAGSSGALLRVSLTQDDEREILVEPRSGDDWHDGDPVRLVIRAERLKVAAEQGDAPGVTVLDARIDAVDYQGQVARYFLSTGKSSVQAINPIDRQPHAEGEHVRIAVRASDCVLLPVSVA